MAGYADGTFVYGPAGAGWKPLAGDWDSLEGGFLMVGRWPALAT